MGDLAKLSELDRSVRYILELAEVFVTYLEIDSKFKNVLNGKTLIKVRVHGAFKETPTG